MMGYQRTPNEIDFDSNIKYLLNNSLLFSSYNRLDTIEDDTKKSNTMPAAFFETKEQNTQSIELPTIESDAVLFDNGEVCIVKPNTPGSVLVVHNILQPGVTSVILEDGLKSRGQLAAEGKMIGLDHLPDYNQNIYFRAFSRVMTVDSEAFYKLYHEHPSDWIAISVDPNKTYAYDSTARIEHHGWDYADSRISLAQIMQNVPTRSSEVLVKLPVLNPEWFATNSRVFNCNHPELNVANKSI
jgi:hypothetical protein